ncbi:MAG: hypothetical protein JW922_01800 [Paludibacteraceae bacterium]|nr:hypothetical protein [Paludibacteraceae bacterium]
MGNYNRDNRSDSRRGSGRRDFNRADFGGQGRRRDMFKAVCDKCGKDCEVPFEPTSGRPIYCSDCFERKDDRADSARGFRDRGPRRPPFEGRREPGAKNAEQFEAINQKLDKILELLAKFPPKEEDSILGLESKAKAKTKSKKDSKKKSTVKKTKNNY